MEIENMELKKKLQNVTDEINRLKNLSIVEAVEMRKKIVEIDNVDADTTLSRLEQENLELKNTVVEQERKLFTLKQTLNRYRAINKKLRGEVPLEDKYIMNQNLMNNNNQQNDQNENNNNVDAGTDIISPFQFNSIKVQKPEDNVFKPNKIVTMSKIKSMMDSNADITSSKIVPLKKLNSEIIKRSVTPQVINK